MREKRKQRAKVLGLLLGGIMLCSGCGILPAKYGPFKEEQNQVLVMNGKGRLLAPVGNFSNNRYTSLWEMDEKIPVSDEECHLRDAARGVAEQLRTVGKVVIFFHGGMNMQVTSMKRAHNLLCIEEKNLPDKDKSPYCLGDRPYFVFVNWQSSLMSSYGDRLWAIREGRDVGNDEFWANASTKITWIPYLASDLLTGVSTVPVTFERQVATFFSNNIPLLASDMDLANKEFANVRYKELVTEVDKKYKYDPLRSIPSVILSPIRVGTTALVNSFGMQSWDIMQRRTSILFDREPVFGETEYAAANRLEEVNGPLMKFGRQLEIALKDLGAERRGELILIGHSMGTILQGEFLHKFPGIKFDSVVFMAAASSVRDLAEKVFPYLAKNPKTEFYNLSLHPQAETREFKFVWLAPEGSLLVWIDQWFEKPDTVLDRTAGRYVNLGMNAEYLAREIDNIDSAIAEQPRIGNEGDKIRNRITYKVFPYQWGTNPQVPMTHGSFDDFYFWEEDFWDVKNDSVGYRKW